MIRVLIFPIDALALLTYTLITLFQAALRVRPGKRGAFELAVQNADKGTLVEEEVLRRATQFEEAGLPVILTRVRARGSVSE